MGRLGDWEMGRWGDWEMGRWGDGEIGRLGDWDENIQFKWTPAYKSREFLTQCTP